MSDSVNAAFGGLLHMFYHAWFRFHPEQASSVGLDEFSGLLRTYDDDDIGALISLGQKMISALDEIDIEELDECHRIDYRIIKAAVSVELHDLQEADWRYRNPLDYVPVHAIYQLLIHPVKDVQGAIKHRLQKIPEHLRGARLYLSELPEQVVPVWLDAAREQCEIGAKFIRNLGRHPLVLDKFTNPARLQPLLDDASHALDEFAHYLDVEISNKARGDFSVGHDRFNRLLNEMHFLDVDVQAMLAFGEKFLEETREQLKAQAAAMGEDADVATVLKTVTAEHPRPEQLLDAYRKRMRDASGWLHQHQLISLPEKESLHIQETPAFLKPLIPFAAYEPPLPHDKKQRGLYYITISDDDALLHEHNQYSIDLTCVHESYPGHHLQFVTANHVQADNMTRTIHASASLFEGWALYCEDLMEEHGFLDKPEHRFMMLRDRLWRALRVIIDVKIHTGELSFDDAVQLMVDELGFDQQQAHGELAWYSGAPTIPLCYATGYALIKALREHQESKPGFDLKAFHDKLLGRGSIALPLVIKEAFGDEAWDYARGKVFS